MAPAITDSYRKDLDIPLIGINYDDLRLDSTVLDKTKNFYNLSLYGCKTTFELVAEIKKIDFSDEEFIFNYIDTELEDATHDEIISSVLDLDMHTIDEETVIGRFVFNFREFVCEDKGKSYAVQVKGAFLEADFTGAKLACNVYDVMRNEYGCVMSDESQSVAGAKLWASSIVGRQDLIIYNLSKDKSVGVFSDGDIKKTSEIWSTTELESEAELSQLNDLINVSLDDKYNIVLLFK